MDPVEKLDEITKVAQTHCLKNPTGAVVQRQTGDSVHGIGGAMAPVGGGGAWSPPKI